MAGFKKICDFGVFASLDSSADTTVTTGGTFYAIQGAFTNHPINDFILDTDKIKYLDGGCWFEIDWHATLSSEDAGRTVAVGIAVNGETLIQSNRSVMSVYCKYAAELIPLSGTYVVWLERDNTVQLQVTSDTDADVVTFTKFVSTIRKFI